MKVNIEDHVPIKCMVGLWINRTTFSIIRDYIHGTHNNERYHMIYASCKDTNQPGSLVSLQDIISYTVSLSRQLKH